MKEVSSSARSSFATRFRRPPGLPLIILAVIGLALLFYSWVALIFAISLCVAYLYFGRILSSKYLSSKFSLGVATLFTHTAVFGLLVLTCSAVSDISLHAVFCIELALFTLLFSYEVLQNPTAPQARRRFITKADIAATAVAVIAFFLLALTPLINLSVQKGHGNILTLITGNVDYGTHLAMFNDYLGFGTVRIWDTPQPARSVGGFYPSSWHAANAAITNAIAPSLHPGTLSAAALGFINVFWISVLLFFVTSLAFTLYEMLTGSERKNLATYISLISIPLLSFYFFDIHIMRFGFFSYTPQLIAILLLAYCLHQLMEKGIGSKSAIGMAVLYCSISLAAWILLVPVAIGGVVIALAITFKRKRQSRVDIVSAVKADWPLLLLALASALSQAWLMVSVKSVATVTLGQGLLTDGGAPIYDTWVYALLFAGLVAAILYVKRVESKKHLPSYEPVLILTTTTILFAGFIFAYQTYHTGTTHYYYYKCLMLLPALLVPIGAAMLGVVISHIKDFALALLLSLAIPAAIVQLVPSDMSTVAFISGSRTVSSTINNDVWGEMYHNIYPTKKVTIYFVNSGTNETSTIATLLVQANRPYNRCFNSLNNDITFMTLDGALRRLTTSPLPHVCNGYNVTFKVDPSYKSIVKSATTRKGYHVDYIQE
jgi:hypothetical protein